MLAKNSFFPVEGHILGLEFDIWHPIELAIKYERCTIDVSEMITGQFAGHVCPKRTSRYLLKTLIYLAARFTTAKPL